MEKDILDISEVGPKLTRLIEGFVQGIDEKEASLIKMNIALNLYAVTIIKNLILKMENAGEKLDKNITAKEIKNILIETPIALASVIDFQLQEMINSNDGFKNV